MNKKAEELAFPVEKAYAIDTAQGISIRDYFAARAMQAYMSDPDVSFRKDAIKDAARMAYEIADAMMEARK
jgi:hypothetical protein